MRLGVIFAGTLGYPVRFHFDCNDLDYCELYDLHWSIYEFNLLIDLT